MKTSECPWHKELTTNHLVWYLFITSTFIVWVAEMVCDFNAEVNRAKCFLWLIPGSAFSLYNAGLVFFHRENIPARKWIVWLFVSANVVLMILVAILIYKLLLIV